MNTKEFRTLIKEANPGVKLTKQKAAEIYAYKGKGSKTQQELAKMYGVSQPSISYIWNKKEWKEIHE